MGKIRIAWALVALLAAGAALAQGTPPSKHVAQGFTSLAKGSKVAIMPTDIELFSMSGGGVLEPKADWTEMAARNFKAALVKKKHSLGLDSVEVSDTDADEFAEINALHGAVARAIAMHHFGFLQLPTKNRELDWSLGDSVAPIRKATGADYALFSFIRDSYASGERKAAMVAIAILSGGTVVAQGGTQHGYASLVDLRDGRVLWYNQLTRQYGDLREAKDAAETLDMLLSAFPVAQ